MALIASIVVVSSMVGSMASTMAGSMTGTMAGTMAGIMAAIIAATMAPTMAEAGFLSKQEGPFGPAPIQPDYKPKVAERLEWHYLLKEKRWPYIGDPMWMGQFTEETPKWYNSLAVFPHVGPNRMHGALGLHPENGTSAWTRGPKPEAINDSNRDALLKEGGGFYTNLSDYLPLDRTPDDNRPNVCKNEVYDFSQLDDASVVITFYNEPLSTLMRTVHSVLNFTPPPLLREIILVDDHSNNTNLLPGSELYSYIQLLPKVKVLRLPQRKGLVAARLAGAMSARAPVLVVLDSHVEVNQVWLEPQLKRLKESPESVVAPQIAGIDSETFEYRKYDGIGCHISFKWVMQEKSQGMIFPDSPDAIPSASMAGGLFAVNRDWFWEVGGYDEQFSMWGAENVEMPFRVWMCGGRVDCTPCAITYHIYRKGGSGYQSPPEAIWKNRLRTARLWTGELFQLTETLVAHPEFDYGPLDEMLLLKERLHCRNFTWFLDNVDKTQNFKELDGLDIAGEIRNVGRSNKCVDTLAHHRAGEEWGTFHCHGEGGTQGFLLSKKDKLLRSFLDEGICLNSDFKLQYCNQDASNQQWELLTDTKQIKNVGKGECLTLDESHIHFAPCGDGSNKEQQWSYTPFKPDPNFVPPTISPEKAKLYF